MPHERDAHFMNQLLTPIRVCANYKPAFGSNRSSEIDLAGFQMLFGADPLYRWLGLDSPLMYAAHKAAGGMTSIYRQIGIGCERLVRSIIQDRLCLTEDRVNWAYEVSSGVGSPPRIQTLTLDARIDIRDLQDEGDRERLESWLSRVKESINLGDSHTLNGAVFEVRQGYKSADSKRQNADLRFGLRSYDAGYLPVVLIVSNQVSHVVARRYRDSKLLVLTGILGGDDCISTFSFFENVIGYNLVEFFERNSDSIKGEMLGILDSLLSAN